jgi:hypothetical protein
MKVLIGGVLLCAFLGASTAEAWPWSNRKKSTKLPRPIDTPIIRPKADDSHKSNSHKRHPERLQRHEWGSEMGRFMRQPQHVRGTPFLYQE